MIILRLILGFGVGFCFGCAYYIGAKVRQEGKWNDEQAQECFAWIFLGGIGAVVLLSTFAL
jgi:hypothetical protein